MSRKNDYRGKAPFSKLTAAAVEREAGSRAATCSLPVDLLERIAELAWSGYGATSHRMLAAEAKQATDDLELFDQIIEADSQGNPPR